jgi:AcrR family transcriptional regulator
VSLRRNQPVPRDVASSNGRLWQYASIRLLHGRHGLPRSVADRIQRDRLLKAIVEVVAEQGYQNSAVEKVVIRSGVSRRTFYDLFANKDDAILAAYREISTSILAVVEAAYAQGRSPAERLERAVRAFLEFWAEHPEQACFCVDEVSAAGAGRACHADTVDRLANLLGGALAELRGFPDPDPVAARAFVGGVYELVRAPAEHDDPIPPAELARRIAGWERRGPSGAPEAGAPQAVGTSAGNGRSL